MGDVWYVVVVGVMMLWVCMLFVVWFLGYWMYFGVFGGWVGLCFEIVVGVLFLWWWL